MKMDQLVKIETALTGELAELYFSLLAVFEEKSGTSLSEMNRALLQTGVIHHLTMMKGLGLIDGDEAERLDALIDSVAKETIMWELVKMARAYWKGTTGMGAIDLKGDGA